MNSDTSPEDSGPSKGTSSSSSFETEPSLLEVLSSCAPRSNSSDIAMIAFVIPLPFPLGIPHHSTIMIMGNDELQALDERVWLINKDGPEMPDFGPRIGVSLKFWRPRRTEVVVETLIREMEMVFGSLIDSAEPSNIQFPSENSAGTVIEASTVLYLGDEDKNSSDAISRAFDRCIDEIGAFLRAVRITTNDHRIIPIGRLSLPPSVPYVVRYGESLENKIPGLFVVNMGESWPIFQAEEFSPDMAAQALVRIQHSKNGYPIFSAEDAFARAKRSFFVESDYAATTVFAYTAIEVFCNGLLSLLMWEQGDLRSTNVNILTTQGFETRLRRHYSPILGGNWDFKSTASPISVLNEVSSVRHRYLHAGVEPSLQDADLAMESFSVVSEFAKDKLVTKNYDFPKTSMMILGESGLRRKNAWTRRFERLLQEIENEPDWLISFADWMNDTKTGEDR